MALPLPQDRLVRKEVALGVIREMPVPENHIGVSQIAPMTPVQSDDVIFEYTQGLTAGLAPARAEDAESELAQKDETSGFGRAAIIDWSLKDHYDASDVTRYRESLLLREQVAQGNFPLTVTSMTEGWQQKMARDTSRRRRKLDNRLEWLIMSALETGQIVYNDGKIMFTVDYGRPAGQSPAGDTVGTTWDLAASDPIGDILERQEAAYEAYGVNLTRALISRKVMRNMFKSDKFTNMLTGANPLYTVRDWSPEAAAEVVSRQTGVNFQIYDSVYRTRPIGGTTVTNNRFMSDNIVLLLPDENNIAEIDDVFGFAATLTSPHAEGEWQSGFYEWERSTVDPWGHDMGTGVKAFPVFPHLELTWGFTVLP